MCRFGFLMLLKGSLNDKNRGSGSSLDAFQTINYFCFVVAPWIRQLVKLFLFFLLTNDYAVVLAK